jgi:hypothetical protein
MVETTCWKCGAGPRSPLSHALHAVTCSTCGSGILLSGPGQSGPRSRRQRSPYWAAILNGLFWGAGYAYLGRSWGLILLVPFCIVMGAFVAGLGLTAMVLWLPAFRLLVSVALAGHAFLMGWQDRFVSSPSFGPAY